MLRDEMPSVQSNWRVDVVAQVIAQGLVDSLNRLPLVVSEKMFDIFEHEGLRARLCEYSLDLKEQGTLRLVHESVRPIQAILFRDTGD